MCKHPGVRIPHFPPQWNNTNTEKAFVLFFSIGYFGLILPRRNSPADHGTGWQITVSLFLFPSKFAFSVGYGSIVPRGRQRLENCHRKLQAKREWVEIGYFRFRLFLFYVSLVRNNFPLSRWLPQTDWEDTVLLPPYAPSQVNRKRQIQFERCKDGNVGNKVLKRKVS